MKINQSKCSWALCRGLGQLLVLGILAHGQDFSTLQKQALAGDVAAQNKLGEMYSIGTGVPRDHAEAAKWFRMAAEKGDAGAQFKMAIMYEGGFGVPKSGKEAISWYQKAAAQKNVDAMWRLATAYQNGRGVPKGPKKAVEWYRMAAELGSTKAQVRLGDIYRDGLDPIQSNCPEAQKWYKKAAQKGDAGGIYGLCFYETVCSAPASKPVITDCKALDSLAPDSPEVNLDYIETRQRYCPGYVSLGPENSE